MRKRILIAIAILICILSVGAERNEKIPYDNSIDFAGQGFEKIYATAYCVGHTTANGSKVHEGGCACSKDHIGEVAIVYTLDGEFIGYLECNDTGAEDGGVRAGNVLDVYKTDMDGCKEFMTLIGAEQKVWVKWIKGEG